jgi:2-desacetyl-2-hydroxyethyl bacteriochlorophyllide A dehydrogenase
MVAMASSWPSGDMTALVFPRANEVAWQTVSIPEPAPRHVLVRIDRLGICGTDVHLFTGDIAYMQNGLSRYPFRPGHEWCGTVAAVAEGVTNVAVGDRVVGEPFLSCGRCSLCLRGKRNHCPNRDELGVRGDSPGAAAEYLRVPAENVAKIAEHIDPAHAVLCEPLVTVLHALSVTRLEPGERIAVMGAGTLGLLAVQVAKAMGAVVDVLGVSDRMWLALENGAEQFLRVDDAVPETYDVVIEASGAATSLALAVRIASPAGRIAQVGMPTASTIPVDAVAIVTKGLQINGVLGGIPFLPRAVTLLENGVVRPELLIDRVLSWHEYERALSLIMDRTMKRPKIILDFESISREASA